MFNFRKIASVIGSGLMIGSTVALAAAANYPQPFKDAGSAAVVVGDTAASSDVLAATDIVASLQSAIASVGGSSSSTTTTSGGDSVKLAKPNNNLNLRDSISSVFGSTLTDSDLPQLLADGTYENDENSEYDFEQRVNLGSALVLSYFSDSDYQDRTPTVGVNFSSSQDVLNYTLDFTSDAESDVSSGDLVDFETTDLPILGRNYYILDAKNNSNIKLTLLDSAASEILSEGETKTITLNGKSYETSIVFISTTQVKLGINGEVTNTLSQGGTYKLSDGTYLGIKDILARDVQGAVGQVEFSLGSGKLELENGQDIQLNDDSVQGVVGYVTAGTSGSRRTIDKIVLQWRTDDDEFITSEQELVMPGFGALKFTSGEFVRPSTEVTTVEDGADDYIRLKTTVEDGSFSLPILYSDSTTGNLTGIGKSANEKTVTSLNTTEVLFNESTDDYLVASWNDSTSSESYILSFSTVTENGINKTTVRNEVTNNDVCDKKSPGDTCTLGSLTLTISQVVRSGNSKLTYVNASTGASFRHLYTADGMRIILPVDVSGTAGSPTSLATINLAAQQGLLGNINFTNSSAGAGADGYNQNSFFLGFTEEDRNENVGAGNSFNVTINDNSDDDLEVTTITTGTETLNDPDDSDHQLSMVRSDLATLVERLGDSSSQRRAQITYSGEESYSDVFLSAPSVTIDSGSGGGTTNLGVLTVTDKEVSSVSGRNMVVVGGSCVNMVASSLLGSSSPLCGADFTSKTGASSGQFLIQAFASPYSTGKVAVLVAGYNAADTTNAAKFLTTQSVDTAVGKKYIGTTATQATLQTSS